MTLHDIFFLVTIGSQFLIVRWLTAQVWFPQIPPMPAAIFQGALTMISTAFAGGLISGGLWFLLIAYPILFSWALPSPDDVVEPLQMAGNRGVTFLIVLSPYLYMLIRLYAQIKQRQDWPSGGNGDRL